MTPARLFMEKLLELANQSSVYGINPDDTEEFIIDDAAALEMQPLSEEWVHFISIRSLKQGQGSGNRTMAKIISLADTCGAYLIGKVDPYDSKVMSKNSLRQWYKKYKANPIDKDNPDSPWIRIPIGKPHKLPKLNKKNLTKINRGLSETDYVDHNRMKKIIGSISVIVITMILIKYDIIKRGSNYGLWSK